MKQEAWTTNFWTWKTLKEFLELLFQNSKLVFFFDCFIKSSIKNPTKSETIIGFWISLGNISWTRIDASTGVFYIHSLLKLNTFLLSRDLVCGEKSTSSSSRKICSHLVAFQSEKKRKKLEIFLVSSFDSFFFFWDYRQADRAKISRLSEMSVSVRLWCFYILMIDMMLMIHNNSISFICWQFFFFLLRGKKKEKKFKSERLDIS